MSWDEALNIVTHRGTCAHEAGHLAAALCLGIEPTSASARMVDVQELEEDDSTPVGVVELPAPDGSRESLWKRAIVALSGKLLEGAPHWPPRWPLLGPETPDERQLHSLVKMLDLDQRGYSDLLRDAYALTCSRRFDRFATVAADLLERHHHLSSQMIRALKAAADDDVERDEDGLISDAEVEHAREQLRQQQEADPALPSLNGDKPKSVTAIREEAEEWAFKYMQAGAHIEVREYEVSDDL